MLVAMKPDEAFNPVHKGLFGADALSFHPQLVAYLIEQLQWLSSEVFLIHFRVCVFLNRPQIFENSLMCKNVHLKDVFPPGISGVYS